MTNPADLQARPLVSPRFGALVLGGVALLLPLWAIYLAVALPSEHVAPDWDLLWAGFDLGLWALAIAALVALRRGSARLPLLAGALAAALVCDAWFDVMTSAGNDRIVAVATALAIELPVAAVVTLIGIRFRPAG